MRRAGWVLRVAGYALAAGVVVLTSVGVAALAVNHNDRPASSEAQAMAAVLDSLPAVSDDENAYVFLLGFAAPRDADPRRIGVERADWIRRLRTDYSLSQVSDPYPPALSAVWNPELTGIFRTCPGARKEQDCFVTLNTAGDEIAAWLAEQQWVLARYATLLRHSRWRDIETGDVRSPYPGVSGAVDARHAWFLDAWVRARDGDAEGVREMLGADLEFWRLVLAEAGTLLTKLTAASMVATHFERSNVILRRLPAESVALAVPQSWRDPFSAEERSLRPAFAYELRFIRSHLEEMQSSTNRYAAWTGLRQEPPALVQRLGNRLASELLQPQDSVNKVAGELTAVADAVEAPHRQIPEKLEVARALDTERASAAHWAKPLYNAVGDLLRGTQSREVYLDAAARIADLEGVRRAALLTAELRSRGLAPGDVEAALEGGVSENPYTGQPFVWHADAGEIVFEGLQRRDGGRYGFWY